jgi:hypothetical protein
MTRVSLLLARITGRLCLWRLTAFLYVIGAGSFEQMKGGVGHLLYSLTMCRKSSMANRLVARLIRRELDSSAENNLWLARMSWVLDKPTLAILIYKRTERQFSGQSGANTAASLGKFAEGVVSGVITAQLDAAIQRLQLSGDGCRPLVVTMVSRRFLGIFNIWLRQAQRHTSAHPLIFALDRESVQALQEAPNCDVVDVSSWIDFDQAGRLHPFSIKNLWVLRVFALRALARRNHDVVSLDVDAIMVGNLDEMLESFPASDIVAQMDYSIPMDVARRFGFILCCGFLILRASDRVVRFLDEYSARTALETDDQLAINHLLAENGISDKLQAGRLIMFRSMGLSWLCPDSSLVSREISSGSVVRHFLLKDLDADGVMRALGLEDQEDCKPPQTADIRQQARNTH